MKTVCKTNIRNALRKSWDTNKYEDIANGWSTKVSASKSFVMVRKNGDFMFEVPIWDWDRTEGSMTERINYAAKEILKEIAKYREIEYEPIGMYSISGLQIMGITYNGPIPKNDSYKTITSLIRMSTPEFFALRKANELDDDMAIAVMSELFSNYRTKLTAYSMDEGKIDGLKNPRLYPNDFEEYLDQISGTPEYERAKKILLLAMRNLDKFEREMRIRYAS